jgi:hypothetical protein
MIVVDRKAPDGMMTFRDSLKFARYSYDSVARGKNKAKFDALRDKLVRRSLLFLEVEKLNCEQMERARKALAATAAIDGVDAHKRVRGARAEMALFLALSAGFAVAAGLASGSAGVVLVAFAFGALYSIIKCITHPFSKTQPAFVKVLELRDRVWSAIASAVENGKQGQGKGVVDGE